MSGINVGQCVTRYASLSGACRKHFALRWCQITCTRAPTVHYICVHQLTQNDHNRNFTFQIDGSSGSHCLESRVQGKLIMRIFKPKNANGAVKCENLVAITHAPAHSGKVTRCCYVDYVNFLTWKWLFFTEKYSSWNCVNWVQSRLLVICAPLTIKLIVQYSHNAPNNVQNEHNFIWSGINNSWNWMKTIVCWVGEKDTSGICYPYHCL